MQFQFIIFKKPKKSKIRFFDITQKFRIFETNSQKKCVFIIFNLKNLSNYAYNNIKKNKTNYI